MGPLVAPAAGPRRRPRALAHRQLHWVESFAPPTYHWGLTRSCGRLTRRVTANVLRAFADGPAAARYPAHDNLRELNAWPGDPIAARHNLWG